jgi:hypothetical protein
MAEVVPGLYLGNGTSMGSWMFAVAIAVMNFASKSQNETLGKAIESAI